MWIKIQAKCQQLLSFCILASIGSSHTWGSYNSLNSSSLCFSPSQILITFIPVLDNPRVLAFRFIFMAVIPLSKFIPFEVSRTIKSFIFLCYLELCAPSFPYGTIVYKNIWVFLIFIISLGEGLQP